MIIDFIDQLIEINCHRLVFIFVASYFQSRFLKTSKTPIDEMRPLLCDYRLVIDWPMFYCIIRVEKAIYSNVGQQIEQMMFQALVLK